MEFSFTCKVCNGKGYYLYTPTDICQVCDGTGIVILQGTESDYRQCAPCHGKGYYLYNPADTCKVCGGVGLIPKSAAKRIGTQNQDDQTSILTNLVSMNAMNKKVFIVHGHDVSIRDQIDLFLTKDLKMKTEVMQAGHFGGRTLPEKFEDIAKSCCFAIFILTADDRLKDLSTGKELNRARQNVILEVGYFWGALGRRDKLVFLVEQDPPMDLPSDIQGIGWIPITKDLGETKMKLRLELEMTGMIAKL